MIIRFLLILSFLIFVNCSKENQEDRKGQALELMSKMQKELLTNLTESIKNQGLVASISHCSRISPKLENEISGTNWKIKRISEKNRNPNHSPDEIQLSVLKHWEEKIQNKFAPDTFIYNNEERFFVMKPILIAPNCLGCHGIEKEILPEVKKEILKIYPNDKAFGYKVGDLRGAFIAEYFQTK
ncbi:hypothetical protein LPTSP3_g35860 [Leptospira kobayashii]|uniref:Tll0287-like domain-containing protein n=1 Tax=Leptospira kobayashii TaxID=1917830 RepID=A0ABN6KKD2_9LEPT|nr:DUF3365 domain-containing protein [Leptospira kobayashii]BDA80656.1 hypothetical protein LPTSP3_g35860 [Leptospira kobayashii]